MKNSEDETNSTTMTKNEETGFEISRSYLLLISVSLYNLDSFYEKTLPKLPFGKKFYFVGIFIAGLIGIVMSLFLGYAAVISYINRSTAEPEPTEASNALLIPGVNDFIPVEITIPVLISVITCTFAHEYGHAIASKIYGYNIRRTGILFFGPIPLGAFVEPDVELYNIPYRERLSIASAGVYHNVLLALIITPIFFLPIMSSPSIIVEAYSNSVFQQSGVQIEELGFIQNTVIWIWFLNINLAFVNMLPFFGTDGTHYIDSILQSFNTSELTRSAVTLSTTACVLFLFGSVIYF